MAMSSASLSTELQAVVPEDTEAEAIQNMADAYANYATNAQAATAILAGGVALGKAAFISSAAGISVSGQGATKLVAAIQAFWAAVAGGLATSFAGATAITPPSAGLTVGALQPVFDSNTSNSNSLVDSVDAVASAIHAQIGGGTVTTPGPTVTPIT